ncbi:MAG: MFS transporter [Thiobacillus sp.]|uniref:MFS transporter n=1 Tax=Thiobacillus sp. TaxID=924 RepID=UPI002895450F|nr:MFS transporter [Thiobacillus sp.]MDT3705579.1 MFS transporter [Thiobacillus sp.]
MHTPSRGSILILALSQALMLSAIVLSMTLAAILGSMLAPDKGLATLPVAAMVIGTAIASLPAAAFMRRYGRRPGFLVGALQGVGGSLLCGLALHQGSFAWFVAGHVLLGSYQGFANYYRFAAVEAAAPAHAGRAVSMVVAGGVVAAFVGPQLAQWGRDWIAGELFIGAYLAQAVLSLVALILLSRLRLPRASHAAPGGSARTLREILAQPVLRVSILGTAIGYAVMIMVMTATPLAILGCGLPGTSVTPVIQWHVVGMFAPSFFTGSLIRRYGAPRIMQAGFVLLLGEVLLALSGVEFLHFLSALVLLGIGWNFAFIGGTTLLTQTYRPAEQLKVQAVNEFAVFGLVALATLSAGWLYDRFGWATLNLAVVPLLVAALIATAGIERRLRQAVPAVP